MASHVVDYVESPYASDEQCDMGHASNLVDTLRRLKEYIRSCKVIMTESYKHKRSRQRLILYIFRVCQNCSDKDYFRSSMHMRMGHSKNEGR